MAGKLLTAFAILCLCACANVQDSAKKSLIATLAYQQDVTFRQVQEFPRGVVCGQYSHIDKWGATSAYRDFIVRPGQVEHRPSDDDRAIYCSEDPAEALDKRFGIGPVDGNETLRAITRDMHKLDSALQAYLTDNYQFPSTAQGLDALIAPGPAKQRPINYRDDGYLQQIPVDPWGRPYRYHNERQLHGEPKVYQLSTLGRDGEPGGIGEDADVGIEHLPYLDHIAGT